MIAPFKHRVAPFSDVECRQHPDEFARKFKTRGAPPYSATPKHIQHTQAHSNTFSTFSVLRHNQHVQPREDAK
jgi:hypothetical protein